MNVRRLAVLPLVPLLLACGADESTATPTVVRDSAGIRIVENGAPAWSAEEAWRLSAEPSLTLGWGTEEEEAFGSIAGATRLSDGGVAVLDRSSLRLAIFDAQGSHVSSAGGPGDGPGELRNPFRLLSLGQDTLLVQDVVMRRVWYRPDGSLLRHESVEADDPTRTASALGDGSYLRRIFERHPERSTTEAHRATYTFVHVPAGNSTGDTIGRFGGVWERWTEVEGQLVPQEGLFSPTARWAAGGHPVRTFLGDNAVWDIHVFEGGRPVQRIRLDEPLRRVTREDDEALVAEILAAWEESRPEEMPVIRSMLEAAPRAATWPAYGSLLVDEEGNLWASEPTTTMARIPTSWTVFDTAGVLLGTVSTPPDLDILEIGADYVLGTQRNALDVQAVLIHDLIKP